MIRSKELAMLEGLVAPATGERLARLAMEIPSDRVIVELGSYKGKSSCYLAEGAKAGRGAYLYCIDAWDLPQNIGGKHGYTDSNVRTTFWSQLDKMGLARRVTALQALSHEPSDFWTQPVGMLFIDASHEYEDVKRDYRAWSLHLAPYAVVVFDDYGTRRNPGVTRFVDEIRFELDDWDFATPPLAIARRRG